MIRAGNFITRQCASLLENRQQAILVALIFSVVPFTSWMSAAIVALITLRKGAKSGFDILLPASVVHSVPLMLIMPLSGALINALIAYIPCYLAALSLRKTEKWQLVFGLFLIQAFVGCLLVQYFVPELIIVQFSQFKVIVAQYRDILENSLGGVSSVFLAQLFFGIQILSVIVSSLLSLILARSIQARLFLPDGFRNELITFRSGRISVLVLAMVSVACYYEMALAINLLPLVLCYFMIAGMTLTYFIYLRKPQGKIFVLLMLLMFLKPVLTASLCIIMGLLDSLFNFRSYLPNRVRESM